jgi:hypothetical protein
MVAFVPKDPPVADRSSDARPIPHEVATDARSVDSVLDDAIAGAMS